MRTANLILLSTLFSTGAALTGLADAQGARADTTVQAQPIGEAADTVSRAEGREAADSALAGALVGMASEQFEGERIEVRIERVDMQAVSPRDRKVSGVGQMKVGNDSDWLPFRYRALYDTQTQTAGWAAITLGRDDHGGESIAHGDVALATLANATRERLRHEFPQQAVTLDIADAERLPHGRYLRYIASGAARFDAEVPTQLKVEGLYDPARQRWLRVSYELGDTANWSFNDGSAEMIAQGGSAALSRRRRIADTARIPSAMP